METWRIQRKKTGGNGGDKGVDGKRGFQGSRYTCGVLKHSSSNSCPSGKRKGGKERAYMTEYEEEKGEKEEEEQDAWKKPAHAEDRSLAAWEDAER